MKKFIAGFLSAIVLTTAIYASSEIKAYLSNATKVQLNGKILELKDAKNQPIYPINYQGSTYLPVRAISQSLGLFVDYDEPTKTVILSKDKITKNDYFKA
ncbi:MAG: stalk domain-containing protein, partial [Eubacteriales bacterium]|nr:stalk domain-containing protein [Eubacteriales bacterium]